MALFASAAVLSAGCATLSTPAQQTQDRRQREREAARQLDQRRDDAEMLAARERFQRGELTEACAAVERLLVRNPDHVEAQRLLAEIGARTPPAPSGNAGGAPSGPPGPETAITLASYQAESSVPSDSPAGRDATAGSGNADRAASTAPAGKAGAGPADRVRGLLASADEALGWKDTDAAVAQLRQACAANPHDPQIPLSAAALLLRHNQAPAAVGLLEESAGRFPNCAAVHRMLGTAHYRLGDHQKAQLAFQQALSLDKSSALSYFLMGCTLAKLGQKGAAEAHFQQAAMLDPRYGIKR